MLALAMEFTRDGRRAPGRLSRERPSQVAGPLSRTVRRGPLTTAPRGGRGGARRYALPQPSELHSVPACLPLPIAGPVLTAKRSPRKS